MITSHSDSLLFFCHVLHQIYAVSITIRIVVSTSKIIFPTEMHFIFLQINITSILQLGFMLIALIWKFDFAPFMVLIIAILNDGMCFFCCPLVANAHVSIISHIYMKNCRYYHDNIQGQS